MSYRPHSDFSRIFHRLNLDIPASKRVTWRFKSSPRHQITRPSQTTLNNQRHCFYNTVFVSANSVRCLPLSLIVPKMEREWSVDGARIGYFLHKVRTLTLHNSNAITHRLLMENTRAYAPAKTAEQTTLTHLPSTQRVAESDRLHRRLYSV